MFNHDFARLQVFSSSKSKNIDFYKEMLYPSFRRHRARIRPFARILGTPIIHIRGARDTNNNKSKFLYILIKILNIFLSVE